MVSLISTRREQASAKGWVRVASEVLKKRCDMAFL